MKIVQAIADSNVLDANARYAYRLRKGCRYLLHDGEAQRGVRGGALRIVGPVDEVLPRYRPDAKGEPRLVLPFVGRIGDALVASSCLGALLECQPEARITVAATPQSLELFKLIDLPITCLAYPLQAQRLRDYTHYLCLEDVGRLSGSTHRSLADVFSECLGSPRPSRPARLRAPAHGVCPVASRVDPVPHIGIQLTSPNSLRSYPLDLTLALARMLIERHVAVWLLGRAGEVNVPLPDHSPRFRNLVGQTATIEKLVVAVKRLDLVVGPDSFLLHLAAALKVPSLTIFTSTNPALAGDYLTAAVATSAMPCSPCGQATGDCPAGFDRCEAHYHPHLRPAKLCRTILSMVYPALTGSKRAVPIPIF